MNVIIKHFAVKYQNIFCDSFQGLFVVDLREKKKRKEKPVGII